MVTKNGNPQSSEGPLARLAALCGVQTAYRDSQGTWRYPPSASVLRALEALGAGVEGVDDPGGHRVHVAILARRRELWAQVLEPVLLAWEGMLREVIVRVPVRRVGLGAGTCARFTLLLEDGEVARWTAPAEACSVVERETFGREEFVAFRVHTRLLRQPLPDGYHRLLVEMGSVSGEAAVIAAPRRCWEPEPDRTRGAANAGHVPGNDDVPDGGGAWSGADGPGLSKRAAPLRLRAGRAWGVFAPVYALRSERDWGAGDLADLATLSEWVAAQGGNVVSTLPLSAGFFADPLEPGPYRPVSRLFWNEFYLAVDHVEEWKRCRAARELWESTEVQRLVRELRAAPLVDYRAVMALKRRVLEELAWCFLQDAGPERRRSFAAYRQQHPYADDYAAFRAAQEGGNTATAVLSPASEAAAAHYHLYCQWQMDEQLRVLAGGGGPGVLLDLPLGVHPDGFDAARWPHLFAEGVSAGAPPDGFFSGGQHWDSPPLHPDRNRQEGHRYFALCLQTLMRHAQVLRIDHVMSFHRLFWVPEGLEPAQGVYVNYPAEELYAVLCLESRRHGTMVVGEDLGTVPPGVRPAMKRHKLAGTWVLQTSLRPRAVETVAPVPEEAVAGLSTHDMFPFAGFLRGDDIAARVETGQLGAEAARREAAARRRLVARLATFLHSRSADAPDLLAQALAYLAASPARLVLVSLEDLLLETGTQNMPGTGAEQPNWRRKMALSLETVLD